MVARWWVWLGLLNLAIASPAHAVIVDAKLGLDYARWGFSVGPTTEIYAFDSKTEAFTLRHLELTVSDLWLPGLDLGLNYLTNELFGATGLTSDQQFSLSTDPIATLFGGYASLDLAVIRFELKTNLRNFQVTRTYRGFVLGPLPLTYLPQEGSAQTIAVGQDTTWAATSRDIQLNSYLDISPFFGDAPLFLHAILGVRFYNYDAPILVELISTTNTDITGALLGAKMKATLFRYGVDFDTRSLMDKEGSLGLHVEFAGNLGSMSLNSPYLDGSGGLSTAYDGKVGLGIPWTAGPIKGVLEAGVWGSYFFSYVSDDDATPKRAIPVYDVLGDATTFSDNTSVRIFREETLYGGYAMLTLSYGRSQAGNLEDEEDAPDDSIIGNFFEWLGELGD